MSGSLRSELHRGGLKSWAIKLKAAESLIGQVITEVYSGIGEDGQYDNAGDDGGLAERLSIAKQLISETMPTSKT